MSSRVYVGGIPYETRERDLESFFKGFGRIKDVLIKNGYGFVEFDDYRDAEDAVYELNGKKLLGMRVSVEMARGKPRGRDQEWFSNRDYRPRSNHGPPVRTNYRVFVENLSSGVSWQDLKDYLRQAGEVTFADAHKKYRNEGIVEFASHEDMKNAIRKFDDTVLNGRRIRIVEDKSSSKKSRSPSRSRSRSKSRSRSSSGSSRKRDRSRSKSRSPREKKKAASRSRSRSANDRSSPPKRNSYKRSRSKSVSQSPEKRFKEDKRSHSRSASPEAERNSRSRSRSHHE